MNKLKALCRFAVVGVVTNNRESSLREKIHIANLGW
jgi:hypothetical protein